MDDDRTRALLLIAEMIDTTIRRLLTVPDPARPAGADAPSLIAAAARMAGCFLLRSKLPDRPGLPPAGTPLLLSEVQTAGPRLMRLMISTTNQLGSPADEAAIGAAAREPGLPAPRLGLHETLHQLDPVLVGIVRATGIGFDEAAAACAIAAGRIAHERRAELPVAQGLAIGVQALVEGSKSSPPALPARG